MGPPLEVGLPFMRGRRLSAGQAFQDPPDVIKAVVDVGRRDGAGLFLYNCNKSFHILSYPGVGPGELTQAVEPFFHPERTVVSILSTCPIGLVEPGQEGNRALGRVIDEPVALVTRLPVPVAHIDLGKDICGKVAGNGSVHSDAVEVRQGSGTVLLYLDVFSILPFERGVLQIYFPFFDDDIRPVVSVADVDQHMFFIKGQPAAGHFQHDTLDDLGPGLVISDRHHPQTGQFFRLQQQVHVPAEFVQLVIVEQVHDDQALAGDPFHILISFQDDAGTIAQVQGPQHVPAARLAHDHLPAIRRIHHQAAAGRYFHGIIPAVFARAHGPLSQFHRIFDRPFLHLEQRPDVNLFAELAGLPPHRRPRYLCRCGAERRNYVAVGEIRSEIMRVRAVRPGAHVFKDLMRQEFGLTGQKARQALAGEYQRQLAAYISQDTGEIIPYPQLFTPHLLRQDHHPVYGRRGCTGLSGLRQEHGQISLLGGQIGIDLFFGLRAGLAFTVHHGMFQSLQVVAAQTAFPSARPVIARINASFPGGRAPRLCPDESEPLPEMICRFLYAHRTGLAPDRLLYLLK